MASQRKSRRPAALIGSLFVLIVATACGKSGGGSAFAAPAAPIVSDLLIWPDEFVNVINDQPSLKTPILLTSTVPSASGATNVAFYADISLPTGTEILEVSYYHRGSSAAAFTGLLLWRVALGQTTELLFGANSNANTGASVISVNVPALVPTPIVIEPGYRYFVQVSMENAESETRGVKIKHQ